MKKLVRSIYKYAQLWNCEKWDERDGMWFYTIIFVIIMMGLGIVSQSYHIDELEAQQKSMNQIINHLESECE